MAKQVKNKKIIIENKLKINDRRIGKFEKDNNAVKLKLIIFVNDQPVFPFFLFSLLLLAYQTLRPILNYTVLSAMAILIRVIDLSTCRKIGSRIFHLLLSPGALALILSHAHHQLQNDEQNNETNCNGQSLLPTHLPHDSSYAL